MHRSTHAPAGRLSPSGRGLSPSSRPGAAVFTPALGDRALFPDLQDRVYLNHAAVSPPSLAVRQAVVEGLHTYATRGVGAFPLYIAQRDRLRGKLAALLGARAQDIALRPNTTQGVIDIAQCLPWRRGDRVLGFAGEFPANVTPWQRAAAREGLGLELLPLTGFGDGSGLGLARVEDALRRGARLLAVSAVQFQTGLKMPLRELSQLSHQFGAELFVDGIQALGALPLEGLGAEVDYLSCGSHKWLMGLEGCAFLYVHPERVSALRPHLAGWLSHTEGTRFLFEGAGHLRYDRPIRAEASFLEGGAMNSLGFAALEAAVDTLAALGVPAIAAHAQRWIDAAEPALCARGLRSVRAPDPAARSAILSFTLPPELSLPRLHAALGARGVACSTPDGHLRFAPHWPNALHEVELVAEALDAALPEARV